MIIKRAISILFILFLLVSCKDKMVCAAYQSSYLLDDEKQARFFSFFENDSLVFTASNDRLKKNIYGLRERDYGYWSHHRMLKVDQVEVYSDEVDSLMSLEKRDTAMYAESGIEVITPEEGDTLELSVKEGDAWSNTKRFHYNVDFVNYMLLVGNDILLAQAAERDSTLAKEKNPEALNDTTSNKKGGFFKKLFKGKKDKKKKEKGDSNSAVEETDPAAAKPEEEATEESKKEEETPEEDK